MNKGLDFKDELTKNDFRYISLVWVSVNQFFLVLLSKYLLNFSLCTCAHVHVTRIDILISIL